MLNNEVSPEVVSASLDHAGLVLTAGVYAKVRVEPPRTATAAMDRVRSGGAGQ